MNKSRNLMPFFKIETDKQLENCRLSGLDIEIRHEDDYDISVIIDFNSDVIKTADNFYYMRKNCILYAIGNHLRLMK